MKIKTVKVIKISRISLIDISFVLFFSSELIRYAFASLFGDGNIEKILTCIVIYTPLILGVAQKPEKYIKLDSIGLIAFIIAFLGITLFIHPSYEYYYTRDVYGVWPYVLVPYRGIYAYLFVRLMDSPSRLERNMRCAGWLMMVNFVYQLSRALARGYWLGVSFTNANAHMAYSVSFGYEVLPFALMYLHLCLKYKKKSDIVATVICVAMMFMGGSRGCILFLGLFLAVYIIRIFRATKHKFRNALLVVIICASLYIFYDTILLGLSNVISQLGFSSRFIDTLLNGSITEDSGRSIIWDATLQMIKDNPLGYGAMGTRFKLTSLVDPGYPHSLVLEILVDYGVIIGSILLILYFYHVFTMLRKRGDWNDVFAPVFCASCCLFLSLTYWNYPSFWMALGIIVNNKVYLHSSKSKALLKIGDDKKRIPAFGKSHEREAPNERII